MPGPIVCISWQYRNCISVRQLVQLRSGKCWHASAQQGLQSVLLQIPKLKYKKVVAPTWRPETVPVPLTI